MSSVRFTNDDSNANNSEPPIDFLTAQPRLSRPSDHFRPQRTTNPYEPPPRIRHSFAPHRLAANFMRDPVTTTLSSFSRVTNLGNFWQPHEEYDNVAEIARELGVSPDHAADAMDYDAIAATEKPVKHPPPALPLISCSEPQFRLSRLEEREFEELQSIKASPHDLIKRCFQGGINSNSLRRKLWPLILGLTSSLDDFDWTELETTFDLYHTQWNAILPDQESRFTAFRERKSIIERDVVRCDRSHPFFKEQTGNLELLRNLLMTYVMYDFDTGYVQGMTDLAAPLLYVWEGDVKKSFWCFVKVMELFKQNFEMSQKTISQQLQTLFRLIKITDPCFAVYLASNESDNCYFAFRWIICQFKREFMKANTDDYDDCLVVWETIWSANALCVLTAREGEAAKEVTSNQVIEGNVPCDDAKGDGDGKKEENGEVATTSAIRQSPSAEHLSPKSASSTSVRLQDIELFNLCICLSIIRRERDLIMANEYDACEILKHFNTLKLNEDFNNILLHASSIWFWMKNDGGESLLYAEDEEVHEEKNGEKDTTADDFDLLQDEYMVLHALNV